MRTAQQDLPSPGAIPWARVGTAGLAIFVGLLLGFIGVTRGCGAATPGPGVSQERYAILVSTLYAEGESLAVVQEYLGALGKADEAGFLIQLAERYSRSGDRTKMRQAEELRRLGQVLQQGGQEAPVPGLTLPPTELGSEPSPLAEASAARSPLAPAMGTIKGQGVRLRSEPSTTAPALSLIRDGEKVEILNVVEGEQVQSSEKRWYKVRSGETVGYVYYTLIAPAD